MYIKLKKSRRGWNLSWLFSKYHNNSRYQSEEYNFEIANTWHFVRSTRGAETDPLDWRENGTTSRTVIPVFVCSLKKPRLSGKKNILENRSRRHFHERSSSLVMQCHGLRHVDWDFFLFPSFKTDSVPPRGAEATGHFSVGAEIRCRRSGSYGGYGGRSQFRKGCDCYPQEKNVWRTSRLCRVDARFTVECRSALLVQNW